MPIISFKFKFFSPHAYTNSISRADILRIDKNNLSVDFNIVKRFYERFPALKMMPNVSHTTYE